MITPKQEPYYTLDYYELDELIQKHFNKSLSAIQESHRFQFIGAHSWLSLPGEERFQKATILSKSAGRSEDTTHFYGFV